MRYTVAVLGSMILGSNALAQDNVSIANDTVALGCQEVIMAVLDQGRVELQAVYFDFNRYNIRPDSLPALLAARDAMQTLGGEWIIEGHTDNVGGHDYNLRLSHQRATALVEWLQAAGVSNATLTAEGFSFDRPVADNATEEGRARNRRVELTAKNFSTENLGFGGPEGVEPDDCSERARVDISGAELEALPDFSRQTGPQWMPHTHLMPTGRSVGEGHKSFEPTDLGSSASPEMCQALCTDEDGCAGWSFEPVGAYFRSTGVCFRYGAGTELVVRRAGSVPIYGGVVAGATILEEGSDEVLEAIFADEADLQKLAEITRIEAPSAVIPESEFLVQVFGPGYSGDWIEIAAFDDYGEPDGGLNWRYVDGANVEGGLAVELTAPAAGDYVLRYIVEHPTARRRTIHEIPLTVGAEATRQAQTRAQASSVPLPLTNDEGAGEDFGYYCPSDALPCRFTDEESGLSFMLMPGFHADYPYFYTTPAGVKAELPSLEVYRTSDGEFFAAVNPRQWLNDMGPCFEGEAGQACMVNELGGSPIDAASQSAFHVFNASLTYAAR